MRPLISICHRCPRRQRPCSGACACTVDGQDIIHHARQSYCPEGRYGRQMPPPEPVPHGYDPRDYRQDSKGTDGCGCA